MANSGGSSQERWLLTRKTWRYMADAGRKLIPDSSRHSNDPATIEQVERNFQEICRKEKTFLVWKRTKNERVQCSAPTSPIPISLNTSDDDITVIENRVCERDSPPCEPLFGLENYGASAEAYQRRGTFPRSYRTRKRSVPTTYDLDQATEMKEPIPCQLEEDSRLVTIGSIEDISEDEGKRKTVRHIGVQTETCLIESLAQFPPMEIDSGKGTEGEFSSPEAPLSPLSMMDTRAESFRSPTSITSGVSSLGITAECTSPTEALRKDSMIQADLPLQMKSEPSKDEEKADDEQEPDKLADRLSKYFKMARRDSVTKAKDKKDRFKTVNYDKTLRNIKSKRINPDTLEDMSEDVKPLDIDEILRQARLESPPVLQTATSAQPQPTKKKKKRRGIQVGEPLPQYILDSLRNVFSSFRPIRKLSKTESDVSAECSSDPLSPRYSIAISDTAYRRELLSDVESSTGALSPSSSTRNSADPTLENLDVSRDRTECDLPGRANPLSAVVSDAALLQTLVQDLDSSLDYFGYTAHSASPKQGFFARRFSSVRTSSLSHQQSSQQTHKQMMRAGRGGSSAVSSAGTGSSSGVSNYSQPVSSTLCRMRSKSQSSSTMRSASFWTPQDGQCWIDIQNHQVVLTSCRLDQLCPVEAALVRQLALERLVELNLGFPVHAVQEDDSPPAVSKPKRRQKMISRKPITASLFDLAKKEQPAAAQSGGMVFGISLAKCLENDRLLGGCVTRVTDSPARVTGQPVIADQRAPSEATPAADKRLERVSCESPEHGDKRLSPDDLALRELQSCPALVVKPVQIPRIVNTCITHIEQYGLNTIGIFRVSSSKKRSRQLREEFDTGKDIELDEDCCPHDVATLLKEFFRDMTKPLLPHELYGPFLATQKVRNRREQLAMTRWLLRLLPVANRDTLSTLLQFLKLVADNSSDRRSGAGDWLTGNRMDSSNLATLFAPNVLHSLAQATLGVVAAASGAGGGSGGGGGGGGCGEKAAAHTAERIDAINMFRSLIDHHEELFQVSAEELHSAYLLLLEHNPDFLDVLLRRRCCQRISSEQSGERIKQYRQSFARSSEIRSNSISPEILNKRDSGENTSYCGPKAAISWDRHISTEKLKDLSKERCESHLSSDGMSPVRNRSADDISPDQKETSVPGTNWLRRRVRSCSRTKRRSTEDSSSGRGAARGPAFWFRRRDKSSGSYCSDSSADSTVVGESRRSSVPNAALTLLNRRNVSRHRNLDKTKRGSFCGSYSEKERLQRRTSGSSSPDLSSCRSSALVGSTATTVASSRADSAGVVTASLRLNLQSIVTSEATELKAQAFQQPQYCDVALSECHQRHISSATLLGTDSINFALGATEEVKQNTLPSSIHLKPMSCSLSDTQSTVYPSHSQREGGDSGAATRSSDKKRTTSSTKLDKWSQKYELQDSCNCGETQKCLLAGNKFISEKLAVHNYPQFDSKRILPVRRRRTPEQINEVPIISAERVDQTHSSHPTSQGQSKPSSGADTAATPQTTVRRPIKTSLRRSEPRARAKKQSSSGQTVRVWKRHEIISSHSELNS